MITLLASLLISTTTDPVREYGDDQFCAVLTEELHNAVQHGWLTEAESADIALRCWSNYS